MRRKQIKAERRNIVMTILMMIMGFILVFVGLGIALISLPFLIIIIGIIPLVGGLGMAGFGVILIATSLEKWFKCSVCNHTNFIFPNQTAVKCNGCKEIILIKRNYNWVWSK